MNQEPTPSTIVSAALLMQAFLLAIAFIGTFVIYRSERFIVTRSEVKSRKDIHVWVIVGFAVFTMGVLLVSDAYAPSLFSNYLSFIAWHRSIAWVFVADVFLALFLVWTSGGSDRSAFTSLYFILPSLAFFLREPPERIVWYVIMVAICFSVGFFTSDRNERESPENRFPFWIVSMLCFVLSLFVGYLTRPR